MNRMILGGLTGLALLLVAEPAHGAISVYGSTPGYECYRGALEGRNDIGALTQCAQAISFPEATERERAAAHVNRGVILLRRSEAANALSDFDRAIQLIPDIGEAYVDRGAALILLRNYADAIAAITRGIELNTDDPHEAYFNRALAHEGRGDIQAAYNDFRRAAELAPEWPAPHLELARFQVRPPPR